jgi:hypothetical protein
MWLWIRAFLRRSLRLTCDVCGHTFTSGVFRFENGQKIGNLCNICAKDKIDKSGQAMSTNRPVYGQ